MSFQPPDLLITGGAPNVGGVSVLAGSIAAPGAGRRLRLWSWSAAVFAGAPVAAHVRFAIANPAGSTFDVISFQTTTGGESGGERHYEGGLARPPNEGISVFGIASAGLQAYFVSLRYTIEDV